MPRAGIVNKSVFPRNLFSPNRYSKDFNNEYGESITPKGNLCGMNISASTRPEFIT